MEKYLYIIGLVLAIFYILSGFDDFIWDLVAIYRGIFRKSEVKEVALEAVFNEPPKLRAVMIAAWQESNVIEDVISHFIESTIYPSSQFHVFVGVYPNDTETIEAIKRLESRYTNVHCVVNYRPGPTTKAQNLNHVVKEIIRFEKRKSWKFHSFTIHDSEDVVSPYELCLSNYYLNKHDGIQFPVFPIIEYPTLKNFFKNITTCTYADEFAENHYLTMYYRDKAGAFVPSAGTGFVLNRDIIFEYENLNFLPQDSLTEDYQLALDLYIRNKDFKYLLDVFPYVNDNYKVSQGFVSTRSMFPNTFKQAVRQKKRWITGITMQTIKIRSILKLKDVSFAGRYSLYRDQKAKFGNLVVFIGYPIYIYFILSLFISLPPIYPIFSLSWWLAVFVTIMMIERLLFRMVSMYKVYGFKSALFSSFFPPFLPFRYVWSNIINFSATLLSFIEKFKKDKKQTKISKKTKKVKWDKTVHTFLPQDKLKKYHIRLGDILLKRKYIDAKDLARILEDTKREKDMFSFGKYLLSNGYINENELLNALADLNDTVQLVDTDLLKYIDTSRLSDYFGTFKEKRILPILYLDRTLVFAISYKTTHIEQESLRNEFKEYNIHFTFVVEKILDDNLPKLKIKKNQIDDLSTLFFNKNIDWQQLLLSWNYTQIQKSSQHDALESLGLINNDI